jgi:hypothetical protein
MHDDMNDKPCDKCNMIMVNYADLYLVRSQVASQLKGAKLELIELKAQSLLLGACTSYLLLISDLEAFAVEIKDLKHKLANSSPTVFYPLRTRCVTLSRVSFFMLPKRTLN